jgi:surfeit locus 1 family protein
MTSFLQKFNRPRPVALILFISAFCLTAGLGTWQVQRLQWKEGLIAAIADAAKNPPITQLPADDAALNQLQFVHAKLTGTWMGNTEFHLTPRYFHGTFGYSIISPFKLADGRILLVTRGWVPAAKKQAETRPETAVKGKATLTGILRVGSERNPFMPDNQPEKNVWFGRDVAQMAEHAKLERVLPIMMDAIGEQDKKILPVPSDGSIKLTNDHFSYVLTWYGVALGTLVIFVLSHRKKPAA